MVNIFELSGMWENVESWLVYAKKLFWIAWPYFSKDMSASFLAFTAFNKEFFFSYKVLLF